MANALVFLTDQLNEYVPFGFITTEPAEYASDAFGLSGWGSLNVLPCHPELFQVKIQFWVWPGPMTWPESPPPINDIGIFLFIRRVLITLALEKCWCWRIRFKQYGTVMTSLSDNKDRVVQAANNVSGSAACFRIARNMPSGKSTG